MLGTQPLIWNGYESEVKLLKYSYPTPHFSYLAEEGGGVHTALTYHRTWETGLIEVTRVSSFSPYFLKAVVDYQLPVVKSEAPNRFIFPFRPQGHCEQVIICAAIEICRLLSDLHQCNSSLRAGNPALTTHN
jgi:hypothetical protein